MDQYVTDALTQPWTTNDDAPLAGSVWDVVVVGGGVAGLLVSEGLAKSGANVLCLDPAPGSGAAARGMGLVAHGLDEHPCRYVSSLGPIRASELYDAVDRSVALLTDRGLIAPCDQVWLAVDEREAALVAASVEALRSCGRAAEGLDSARIARLGLGADHGFRWPGGGLVHATSAWDALSASAAQAGVTLRQARGLSADGRGHLVTDQGTCGAEVVVWACGAASAAAGSFLEAAFIPVLEQRRRWPALLPPLCGRAGQGWTSFRPAFDGDGALVSGCRWAMADLGTYRSAAVIEPAVQERLVAFGARHLGDTQSEGPADAVAWIAAHTCDGLPMVGPVPGDVRQIVCAGFVGNDWGFGPAAAIAVVEGLVGEQQQLLASWSPARLVG